MALQVLQDAADDSYAGRDWARYTEQMVHFHRKNAESWGNAKTGVDLADQIDPDFVLHERLGHQRLGEPLAGVAAGASGDPLSSPLPTPQPA